MCNNKKENIECQIPLSPNSKEFRSEYPLEELENKDK